MSNEIPADVIIKILLVDDEENITKSLRRLLMEVDQYEVFVAQSGEEGLEIVASEQDIGVIISDQRMPNMTGVEFLSQVRKIAPDAIRILLTGYADIEASIGAINQGAVFRYLTKPWENEELLGVVAEAARNYWLIAENRRLNELVAKQKVELEQWNARLKQRVLEQTSQIREKSDALAESNQQLKTSFTETIEALTGLIEMRDRRSSGHSRNVAALVAAMAKQLKLSPKQTDIARSAGLLHDIGKIAMSDQLIVKAAKDMDTAELIEYRNHVIRGQAALNMVPSLRDIGLLIRHHHEKYNGSGFPDRLAGEDIPLGSRLICAADMFERNLSQFSKQDALEESFEAIANEWGTGLDPALRNALEQGAKEVYRHLRITAEVYEKNINPKDLRPGMRLKGDLYSGTGVLLLKQGTIFDEEAVEAVKRCQSIDPFEKKISVLIDESLLGDAYPVKKGLFDDE